MAHKKGVGSTDNGRDSKSKRLGVKLFGGQHAIPGNIIVRQRGTKYHAGLNVGIGRDHTLYALSEGFVTFSKKKKNRTFVSVEPTHVVTDEVITGTLGSMDVKDEVVETVVAPEPSELTTENLVDITSEEPKKEEPKAKAAAPKKESGDKKENLKKVEGIGPKTEEIFNSKGIMTWAQLAATSAEDLKSYLSEAGSRYEHMDPTTWPEQAQMLADGKMDELKAWQDKLDGGRVVDESE